MPGEDLWAEKKGRPLPRGVDVGFQFFSWQKKMEKTMIFLETEIFVIAKV